MSGDGECDEDKKGSVWVVDSDCVICCYALYLKI
jgi:hypothetical protein